MVKVRHEETEKTKVSKETEMFKENHETKWLKQVQKQKVEVGQEKKILK